MWVRGETIDIIPIIPISNKNIVDVEWENLQIKVKNKHELEMSIFELTEELMKEYNIIYIFDINGILNYKPQLSLIKKIASKGKLWIDTGVRYSDDIIDPIVADINKIVIGSKTLSNINELYKAVELSEEVILGIDYDNGIINQSTRLEISLNHLLNKIKILEIDRVVLYDWNVQESNNLFIKNLADIFNNKKIKLYIGGGVNREDFDYLESLGIEGALIDWQSLIEV